MALETMINMLIHAREQGYAVGAFNIVDYSSMRAVVQAAEELSSPVIVQTSVKTVRYWGHSTLVTWIHDITEKSRVAVALHLDHCREVEFVKECIDAGWTSVMYDGSAMPFDQNLANTQKVVDMAKDDGVSVEAELGKIIGVEEEVGVQEDEAHLADPDEAILFCRGLNLAAFAPAIGTAHGIYKGTRRIAYDRIKKIASATGVLLALHGGTGLQDEVFKKCISLGCAKINIST